MTQSNAQILRILQKKKLKEFSSGLKSICQGLTIGAINPVKFWSLEKEGVYN